MNISELIKYKLKIVNLYLNNSQLEPSDFRKSYDTIAPFFDNEWSNNLDESINKIFKNIPPINPKFILDLGCGTASSASKLRALFPEAHITGLDYSRSMLRIARKKVGIDKSMFFNDSIEEGLSKFKNSQFDLIIAAWSLEYCDHKNIYKEISRILSDKGILVVICSKEDSLKEIKLAIKHTMIKHYNFIQKIPVYNFPQNKNCIQPKLAKNFDELVFGEESLVIDFKIKHSVLDWFLDSGALAGYEYVLDFRNNFECGKTYEEYIKSNFNNITHSYMWFILKKK